MAIRVGDIYSTMIEVNYAHGSRKAACAFLKRMKQQISRENIYYFVDPKIVHELEKMDESFEPVHSKDRAGGDSLIDEDIK